MTVTATKNGCARLLRSLHIRRTHDREDEAQNLIVAKRRTPENRGIMFKIEIPDTETAIGKATVSKLKVPLAAGCYGVPSVRLPYRL